MRLAARSLRSQAWHPFLTSWTTIAASTIDCSELSPNDDPLHHHGECVPTHAPSNPHRLATVAALMDAFLGCQSNRSGHIVVFYDVHAVADHGPVPTGRRPAPTARYDPAIFTTCQARLQPRPRRHLAGPQIHITRSPSVRTRSPAQAGFFAAPQQAARSPFAVVGFLAMLAHLCRICHMGGDETRATSSPLSRGHLR